MNTKRRACVTIFLLWLAGFAFHAPAWNRSWHPTWDSAVYLGLARQIHEGAGYTWNGSPHLKYPPGLPLLLAPSAGAPGADVGTERAIMIACALAWMALLYAGLRKQHGEGVAIAVALAAGLSYAVLYHTVRVLSDVPFLVPWTVALLLGDRLRTSATLRIAFAFAVLATMAFAFRVVTLVLLPTCAVVLWPLWRAGGRQRRIAALACGIPLVAMGGWFARTALLRSQISDDLRDERSYEHELATGENYEADAAEIGIPEAVSIAVGNLDYLRGLIGEAASAYIFPALSRDQVLTSADEFGWWFGAALSVLSAWALARLYRQRPFLVLATVTYFALIVLWPSRQGVRFLLPAFPALYLAWISGTEALAARFTKHPQWGVTTALVLLLGAHGGAALYGALAPADDRRDWSQIYTIESERSYETLPRALAEEAARALHIAEPASRLAADQAAYLVYRTGVDARSFPIVDRKLDAKERGQRLLAELRKRGFTHVALIPDGAFAWSDLIEPLLYAAGPLRIAEEHPETALALQQFLAGERPARGGADLILPLSAF